MTYELIHRRSFGHDLIQLVPNELKKVIRALSRIEQDPVGKNVKKILKDSFSNLYRYRVGDLRICYALGTGCVALIAVGPRDTIYSRLRRGTPNTQVHSVDSPSAVLRAIPREFSTRPDDPIPTDLPEGAGDEPVEEEPSVPVMPTYLLEELVNEVWNIPQEHREAVLTCGSAEELIELDLPEGVLEKVLHLHAPPTIQEAELQPSYLLPNLDELERDTSKALSSLLLVLDEEQKRAASAGSRGPLLVRGGPGTGKSIVALYRIRNLYERALEKTVFEEAPPKTLFVTYTKALTRVSDQLLGSLLGPEARQHVTVRTIDSIARQVAGDFAQEQFKSRSDTRTLQDKIVEARHLMLDLVAKKTQVHETLSSLPVEYLLDEFQWVIDGRAIEYLDEYLSANRTGRGTRFGPELRRLVWRVYNTWLEDLEECGIATYEQVQCEAVVRAEALPEEEKFDVVVLDEAQDLKPIGIRLALAMCKDPSGFYMTADENQSIYGRGYSWRQVSSDLRVQGRSVLLRHNYRTTRQIQEAALAFLRKGKVQDPDSIAIPVHEGPKPVLCECVNDSVAIAQWFQRWGSELRLPIFMGAVLTPTNAQASEVAERLTVHGIAAKALRSGQLDVNERVVKCLTLHAAKGLEFPFVAVTGLTDKHIPRRSYVSADDADWATHVQQERQLLHVAMTRAMWRLLVCKPARDKSPFFTDLDDVHWHLLELSRAGHGGDGNAT